ncbi:MAG TPA: EAL domain-containing protein, partial [Mycobacteriales bacterium]|nr:EAL domain-containing protein [Mycobacteriales bacterium]
ALLAATRASARRHEAVVQHSSDMLMLVDALGRTTWASASTLRRAGVELGRSVLGIVVPEDRPVAVDAFERVTARHGETTTFDVRVHTRDGRVRTVEVVANNLLADAAVRSIVLTVRDVTDEREAAHALQLQARQQAVLAGIGSRALTATRLDDLFDHACHAVNDVLGTDSTGLLELMPEGDLLVRAGTLKSSGIGTTRIVPDAALAQVLSVSRTVVVEDYLDHPESWRRLVEPFGVRSGVVLPVVVEGRVWGLMSCHDTVPRRFSQVELDFLQTACTVLAGAVHRGVVEGRVRHQATHDALTGLPNRTTLQAVLGRAVRSGGRPALLLLDLDDFKDVNDSLGHGAGDRVLAQLGERLRATVGDLGVVARLGGDEFAVCLEGPHAADRAVALATSLTEAVAEPFRLPGLDITLSVSTGIALAPEHGRDADRLLQHADLAMYRAKATRRGWAVFDAELDRERSERLSLLVDLRDALATDQLELHYQPLVGLADGRVAELEALVRWHHPERGLLLPGVFVPLAEQTDLIDDLTVQVAQRSAAQAAAWAAEGYDVRIACNVSPASLRDRRVVARLAQVLAGAQGRLELEITESALVDEEARDAVVRLVHAGATCAVDDFGTGYSALSYLRDLPVTRLKLDRSLSVDVDTDERAAALVSGVVQLAHDLRLLVVAEGVERPEVGDALAALGVDVAQGWLYGRAAPPSALDRTAWRRR